MADKLKEFSKEHLCPEPGSDGACGAPLQASAEKGLTLMAEAMDDPTWGSAAVAKSSKGVVVRSRPYPSSKSHQFHVSATFSGVGAQAVFDGLLYENRIAWDPAITTPAYLRRHAGSLDVVAYTTKPAMGGLICGRGFVDVRAVTNQVSEAPDGGPALVTISAASSRLPDAFLEETGAQQWLELAKGAKLIPACNLAGSGSRIVERVQCL